MQTDRLTKVLTEVFKTVLVEEFAPLLVDGVIAIRWQQEREYNDEGYDFYSSRTEKFVDGVWKKTALNFPPEREHGPGYDAETYSLPVTMLLTLTEHGTITITKNELIVSDDFSYEDDDEDEDDEEDED